MRQTCFFFWFLLISDILRYGSHKTCRKYKFKKTSTNIWGQP